MKMIQLDRIHTSSTRLIPFLKKQVSGYQYHKMTNLYILVNLWLNPEICSVVSWTVSWIKGVNLSFGEKGDLNLESANPVICRTLAHTVKWVHCPCSYTVLFLPLNGDWETSEVVGSRSRKWQPKTARNIFSLGKYVKRFTVTVHFKLTIHLNISHDDYCIVDGTSYV